MEKELLLADGSELNNFIVMLNITSLTLVKEVNYDLEGTSSSTYFKTYNEGKVIATFMNNDLSSAQKVAYIRLLFIPEDNWFVLDTIYLPNINQGKLRIYTV